MYAWSHMFPSCFQVCFPNFTHSFQFHDNYIVSFLSAVTHDICFLLVSFFLHIKTCFCNFVSLFTHLLNCLQLYMYIHVLIISPQVL